MAIKPLRRRAVLKGVLATGAVVTVPLPLLDLMLNGNGTALAQTGMPLSPLYVTWFFGNGSLPGRWKPEKTGTGSNWDLSPQLQPLAAVKSHLTVVSGLENKLVIGGMEHPTGSAGATTGAPLTGNAVRAASIDQLVADLISNDAPFKSLEIGVTPATPNGPQDSLATVSHSGPNAKNSPELSPRAVFDRLFMTGTTDNGTDDRAAKLAGVRASMLDAIKADGVRLQQRLGAADKQRMEEHLDSIRAIEQRLTATSNGAGQPAMCASPTAPTAGRDNDSEAPPDVNSAMVDLATLALACDRTRVLSFMFSLPAAHVYYRHLAPDMNDDFHDTICHGDAGDEANQPRVDKGVLYAMTCLNELLTKMQATPYGATTLLDQTLVYVTSDTAWGKTHTRQEWPVLLAGKAGGKLRGDGHFAFPNDNLSKALLTVAQIMGSPATELGIDAGQVTAPLSGLIV